MEQSQIEFPSESPLNTEKLGGQNLRLYNYLLSGKTIHCFDPAKKRIKNRLFKFENFRFSKTQC